MKNKPKQRTVSVTASDAFPASVFTISVPYWDAVIGWYVEVVSTLGDRSTFDIVWFRLMGAWLIDDMYVVGDGDDGQTMYQFRLTKS